MPVAEAEVPDYYLYIRVPMDLSTIEEVRAFLSALLTHNPLLLQLVCNLIQSNLLCFWISYWKIW